MTDNLKDHFEDCKQVEQVVANANALLSKAQMQLMRAREVLELLLPYQHEKMTVDTAYKSWLTEASKLSAPDVIKAEVRILNAFLGDRA